MDKNYSENIFINCPFDDKFDPIFSAIVFTVHICGFIPRCAKEYEGSDEYRMENIYSLIKDCKYGIHDLSRLKDGSGLPRFNMPFELGVFIGCKKYGSIRQKKKRYLILETNKFRFKKYISDISGQDIRSHNDKPLQAISGVRDWLASINTYNALPHASTIAKDYKKFKKELPNLCFEKEWTVKELRFPEYSSLVTTWLNLRALDKLSFNLSILNKNKDQK